LISNVPLPEVLQQARLETGTTVLMERLIQCIEENAEKDNQVGNRMLPPDDKETQSQIIFEYDDILTEKSNTQQQTKAIQSALTRDITYIWGPPGTGKTSVISKSLWNLTDMIGLFSLFHIRILRWMGQ
jgi:putative ribosome biogenesis GTPase RsgA